MGGEHSIQGTPKGEEGQKGKELPIGHAEMQSAMGAVGGDVGSAGMRKR